MTREKTSDAARGNGKNQSQQRTFALHIERHPFPPAVHPFPQARSSRARGAGMKEVLAQVPPGAAHPLPAAAEGTHTGPPLPPRIRARLWGVTVTNRPHHSEAPARFRSITRVGGSPRGISLNIRRVGTGTVSTAGGAEQSPARLSYLPRPRSQGRAGQALTPGRRPGGTAVIKCKGSAPAGWLSGQSVGPRTEGARV